MVAAIGAWAIPEPTPAATPAGAATTLATDGAAAVGVASPRAAPEAASSSGMLMRAESRIGLNYRHAGFQPRACRVHRDETSSTFGSEICVPGRRLPKSRSGLYCCNSPPGPFSDFCVILHGGPPGGAI